jgi:myo-inositol 2-dehydrogenase/D-chiro-inositol 1-dehydrogenase
VVLNVGVIGTGNIGTDHVGRLSSQVWGARVAAVFDVAADRARRVAEPVGATAHRQAIDVIDDPGVDAVLVASPGDTHAELVLACIAAGKPVLCEKPLATTADTCLKVLEAEAATGRRFVQVGFMRRYDAGYRVVKAVLDDGSIGVPLLAHCVHRNAAVPAGFSSDMAMTDSVIHEIDTARWLLGEEIVATTVVAVRSTPLAAEHLRDPQLVLLEMEGGALVEVEVFVNCQYGYDVRCEVVGSTGAVSLDNPSSNSLVRQGQRAEAVPPDWRARFGPAYVDELTHWVAGLHRGVVAGPSSWDGYAATAVAESCVASLIGGGRTTVSLVDRPALYG